MKTIHSLFCTVSLHSDLGSFLTHSSIRLFEVELSRVFIKLRYFSPLIARPFDQVAFLLIAQRKRPNTDSFYPQTLFSVSPL